MTKRKKYLTLLLSVVLVIGFSLGTFCVASASNDNIGFTLDITSYRGNSRLPKSEARERTAKKTNNAWKVKMTDSGEGQGSITVFWLIDDNDKKVSPKMDVKCNSQAHYKEAYASASGKRVRLEAENNNFNSSTYSVTGVWDEETEVYL